MADLSIVTMRQCAQISSTFEKRVGKYLASIRPGGRGSTVYSCECPSYKYQRGIDENGLCKHLRQLVNERCSYHQLFDGPANEDGTCPRCGGPTEVVKVGV